MNEDIFLIAAIFSCNKYHSLFAEKYEILKLEWSRTLLRNHIQPERWGTDRFFHIIIFHIYMDYFIAFLKYFTDVRVKKCPFCTQQWLKNHFRVAKSGFWGEFSQVLGGILGGSVFWNFSIRWSEVPFPRYSNSYVWTFIHFAIQSTPQNLGKLTSEPTFAHSKVLFRPLLRMKRTITLSDACARFKRQRFQN